jgi:TonB family protein
MKHQSVLFFSGFAVLLLTFNIFSQSTVPKIPPVLKDGTNPTNTSEFFQVSDVRGAVKNKAIYLAKPVYSSEAREAGAEGKVTVEIMIDEEGNVIAANSVSSHSLLKASSEDAARRTKFRILRDGGGQAVKSSGVLTYNFAIQKAGWSKIGYDLAILEKVPTLTNFSVPIIAKAFQPEWTIELALLEKIAEMKRVKDESQASPLQENQFVFSQTTEKKWNGMVVKSTIGEKRLPIPNPPTPERISISQNLISFLQARLGNDELSFWQFNLGINLSKAFWFYRNPKERLNAVQVLKQSADSAPPGASAGVLIELKKLAVVFEREKRTVNTENEIGKSLSVIFRNK